eukprot:scaffold115142_cov17-Tisochrysis_lutea.AAC.4
MAAGQADCAVPACPTVHCAAAHAAAPTHVTPPAWLPFALQAELTQHQPQLAAGQQPPVDSVAGVAAAAAAAVAAAAVAVLVPAAAAVAGL